MVSWPRTGCPVLGDAAGRRVLLRRIPMQVKLLDLTAQYINIRREIRKVIDDICDAQAFVLGPVVERFEKNLAGYCGTKHAIGVSSGTDALLCSLMALDIKRSEEHTSELQSPCNLVCRLLLEKKKDKTQK